MAGMCTLTWRRVPKLNAQQVLVPVFLPLDSFLRAHGLQWCVRASLPPTTSTAVMMHALSYRLQ